MTLLDGNEIPPGGEGKISVHVKTGTRKRRIRKIIKVQTNDPIPESASFNLTVFAEVDVELDVLPNNILRFNPARAETTSLRLKNYTDQPVRLSQVSSSDPQVNISISSMTIPPQGEVMLTGTLLPDHPQGAISGWLKIRSDLKTIPLIQIRLWGKKL
ncbi:hypothetical protein CSA56_13430 [candidate division KSB3 bacterium]|uniref:DUF1573 domain-containing protein n=1 Tax=candidate division KSB3 bacterium TaxID=2044937 RepID=A0A2G6KBJ3_9BACT|nr:MAG: hypothetical protein CSA56_13430 [candidate division KSB3 bacterium]